MQGKFSMIPSVFATAAHHHAGLKRDAASVWIEDVTQSSFKVCLRELQNYAGSHEDVHVVSVTASAKQDLYRTAHFDILFAWLENIRAGSVVSYENTLYHENSYYGKNKLSNRTKKNDFNTGIDPLFLDFLMIINVFVFFLIEMVGFFLSPQASFHRA